MTNEELITRLREDQPVTQDMVSTMQCALQDEAADRIEQLGKACAEWADVSQSNYQRAKAAEAKLAKAVEALEKVQAFVRDLAPYADQGHALVPALFEACETLEELKGEARNG